MTDLYVKLGFQRVDGVFTNVDRNKASFKKITVDYDVSKGDSVYVMTNGSKILWVYNDRLLATEQIEHVLQPRPTFHNVKIVTESGKVIKVNTNAVQLFHCVIE